MIKFDKNIWFLYFIICFLIIFNLALSFRIPLILPLSGLVVLCILPGYLICLIFEIKVTDLYENILYSIGLSIVFDLLFGLLINTLLPLFGISNPLSYQNLQMGFSIIILVFASLIVYTDKAPKKSIKLPKILKIEKGFLIFAFAILVFIQAGIYLVNADITNLFLIFSILLMPVLFVFLIVYYNNSINRLYPFILYLISFSLLMLLTLRSNYIIGIDTHAEYNFFYTTLIHSVWVPDPSLNLSASLNISILPTLFVIFLDLDPHLLFKILYPLLFSITPLIIYVIVKKYANELLAFFAACFFMFQNWFIITSVNSRTSLAILFFAFLVLTLCNTELSKTKKYILILLFIPAIILSHYTSALIVLLIIFSTYLIEIVADKFENRTENRFINLTIIVYFVSLIFFWYGQIINNVFRNAIEFSILRINIFSDLLKNDVSEYIYPSFVYTSSLMKFIKITQILIYVLIGMGILFALYGWFQKNIRRSSLSQIKVKINRTLLFMSIVPIGLFVCIVFAPFLFFGYDTGRTLELINIILSVFLIVGACNLFNLVFSEENKHIPVMKFYKKIQPQINYCKSNQNKIVSGILLFLLIPSLLLVTGISYQFDGIPYSIILNSPKNSINTDFGYSYIFDQDARALQWFKVHSDKDAQVFSDAYGNNKITSLIKSTLNQKSLVGLSDKEILERYFFLTVTNEYYNIFREADWKEIKITQFGYILNMKNKIFSNGAVIYK